MSNKNDTVFITRRRLWFKDPSKNNEFVEQYLENKNFRMRGLFAHLPQAFWNKHSNSIIEASKNGQLLFRAKIQRPDLGCVEILNVWSSKDFYNNSFKSCQGDFFVNELAKAGVKTSIQTQEVSRSDWHDMVHRETRAVRHKLEVSA